MQGTQTKKSHDSTSPALYVAVWAALIVLTGISVGVSYIDLRNAAILMAVMIATLKSALVLLYFMHVRHAQQLVINLILVTLVVFGVLFGLTMVDYWYR